MDSHTSYKNTEGFHVLFTQFPPMTASCKTKAQYHNQGVDIDTIKTCRTSIATGISPVAFFYSHTMPPL